jgi:hypothetical protein
MKKSVFETSNSDRFIFPEVISDGTDELDQDLLCVVCKTIPSPYPLICKGCEILLCVCCSSSIQTCPQCLSSEGFKETDSHNKRFLNLIEIKCQNCNSRLKYKDYQNHLQICQSFVIQREEVKQGFERRLEVAKNILNLCRQNIPPDSSNFNSVSTFREGDFNTNLSFCSEISDFLTNRGQLSHRLNTLPRSEESKENINPVQEYGLRVRFCCLLFKLF